MIEPAPLIAPLPSGSLTFLLTDIESSTALWEHHESAMHVALARHDALVVEAVERDGGRFLKARGEGDSTFSVFAEPATAL